ncbi:N-acyl-phosphatidylethanolamine-hydrolyzing phospholipase D [Porphyridium purpureum]|uniref:N-acyl-phosphatidylethanolamine-hydrolyzing phospholipase D n=1 Tax=Porphyridium purpureum TaxID=35688 RepID=A0A5J4YZX5_PORPP|nr:N-acyl-phosphatidylethanolamine-hydrolyzing phospholipase D [Porphyridium purpureum]|eukprot:POR8097..scf208_2
MAEDGKAPSKKRQGQFVNHFRDGLFFNPWESFKEEHAKMTVPLADKTPREPVKDVEIAALALLSSKPDFEIVRDAWFETRRNVGLTWLGHCTYIIQMYGATILTDPNFAQKCPAPYLFGSAKRLSPVICPVEHFPQLDIVVITAATDDKLVEESIRDVVRVQPNVKFLVPLGVGETLVEYGVDRSNVQEMDWYDEVEIVGIRAVCCPSQHLSGKISKGNGSSSALWCSWTFIGPRSRVFYVGSTGYRGCGRKLFKLSPAERASIPVCPAFKEIGELYGPIDLALVPVGNYAPRAFTGSIQSDPCDSVDLFCDLRARQAVAHNWGTFTFGNEEVLQPLRDLERAMHERGVSDSEFAVLLFGKTMLYY